MQKTITIPANGAAMETSGAKFLTVMGTPAPFAIAFDGGPAEVAQSGQVFNRTPYGGFGYANLINPTANALDVTYDVGNEPAAVQQSSRVGSTRAFGNCGMGIGGGTYNGQTIGATGSAATFRVGPTTGQVADGIFVKADNFFKIAGSNNGSQRKLIAFQALSGGNFKVVDVNGKLLAHVSSSSTFPTAIETDAEVWLYASPADGDFTASIMEFYFSAK